MTTNSFIHLTGKERDSHYRKAAQDLFGTTKVIGKTITDNNRRHEYRISAIVSDWGEHSNFKYAFMGRTHNDTSWDNANYKMLIKINPEQMWMYF